MTYAAVNSTNLKIILLEMHPIILVRKSVQVSDRSSR